VINALHSDENDEFKIMWVMQKGEEGRDLVTLGKVSIELLLRACRFDCGFEGDDC
jgi:hypothetical protein